jgi:pyridoxine/pyridoxamine 5'-phosphate oxidase
VAQVKYSYRAVKNGVRCEGRVKLACKHTVSEYFTARTNDAAKAAVDRMLPGRIQAHVEDCTS